MYCNCMRKQQYHYEYTISVNMMCAVCVQYELKEERLRRLLFSFAPIRLPYSPFFVGVPVLHGVASTERLQHV